MSRLLPEAFEDRTNGREILEQFAFTGWNGRATIIWEDRGLTLDLEAGSPLSTFILYSPSADARFFCFEPVSHVVDAHNLPPGPEAHGLVVLTPDETLAAECRFRVH